MTAEPIQSSGVAGPVQALDSMDKRHLILRLIFLKQKRRFRSGSEDKATPWSEIVSHGGERTIDPGALKMTCSFSAALAEDSTVSE